MALRPKLGPGSGVIPGTTFFEEYEAAMKGLFDASALPLTNVGGTPNDVTADLYWELDAGLIDGMKFTLTWAASNDGPMTLSINGGPSVPLLDGAAETLPEGAAEAGRRCLIEYVSGQFLILAGDVSGVEEGAMFWRITASSTWQKPQNLPDNHMFFIEAWGSGGGGRASEGGLAAGGGGGGGEYRHIWIRHQDLPASVSVAIGAGGAARTRGGDTTFGSILVAQGGGGASQGSGGAAGGFDGVPSTPPIWVGGSGVNGSGIGGIDGPPVDSWFGGAGGGGISVFGGNGGDGGQPGQAPGGGGGHNNGTGARGEVRIWA